MTLYDDFCAALNDARNAASNSYLQLLAPYIKNIETTSHTDSTLVDYCNKLTAIAKRKNFVLNGNLVAEFAQLFGEAHFAALCPDQGVSLNKIPEQKDNKTPDFCHSSLAEKLFFEVKTLSVVGLNCIKRIKKLISFF